MLSSNDERLLNGLHVGRLWRLQAGFTFDNACTEPHAIADPCLMDRLKWLHALNPFPYLHALQSGLFKTH